MAAAATRQSLMEVRVMEMCEAQSIAAEALRAMVSNPDFYHVKDLIGRELDLTDEILDAEKYHTWINGLTMSLETADFYTMHKTLWDIPFTYLPKYVFASGFDIAAARLPSDGSGVQISEQAAKELKITWINLPGAK